jgi:protein phosphatase
MALKFHSFGISDIGRARTNNEDLFAILEEKRLFLLADGMGGHLAGEVAAAMTLETLNTFSSPTFPSTIEEGCLFLRKALQEANQRVFALASNCPNHLGMGTTLSCFMLMENHLIYAHVGDSRLYRYRQDLYQLTEDHSTRQCRPFRAPRQVLTRAVGTNSTLLPDIGVIPLQPGDLYMLCSDGLSDSLKTEEIAKELAASCSLEEKGGNLVKTALEKGGNDNITLLLVQIGK